MKLTRIETLQKQIRKAYIDKNYEKAKELEEYLNYFWYGITEN